MDMFGIDAFPAEKSKSELQEVVLAKSPELDLTMKEVGNLIKVINRSQ